MLFKKGQMSLNPHIKVRTVNKEWCFKVLSLCVMYITAACTHRSLRHIGLSSPWLSTFSSESGSLTGLEARRCTWAGQGSSGICLSEPHFFLPLPTLTALAGFIGMHHDVLLFYMGFKDQTGVLVVMWQAVYHVSTFIKWQFTEMASERKIHNLNTVQVLYLSISSSFSSMRGPIW